jgi:hypothetical protein
VATALARLDSKANPSGIGTQDLMAELRLQVPTSKDNPALDALKTLRDKRLAHAEHIDEIGATQWALALAARSLAKSRRISRKERR